MLSGSGSYQDEIIEILDLSQLDQFWQDSSGFQIGNGFGIGCVLVHIDHTRSRLRDVGGSRRCELDHLPLDWTRMRKRTSRGAECFDKEELSSFSIASWTQEELKRVPLGIDGPVEIGPDFLDFDVGLVHAPGVVAGFEVRSTTLLQFRRIALHPAIDRGMIDRESTFSHHFFEVTIAECIAEIPTNAQENDVGLKMTPLEGMLLVHEGDSSAFLAYSRDYQITIVFATQPEKGWPTTFATGSGNQNPLGDGCLLSEMYLS